MISQFLHSADGRTLLARIVLGALAAIASLLLLHRPVPARLLSPTRRSFDVCLLAAYTVLRLLLFAAIFLVAHQTVHGDLPAYYLPQAQVALQGKIPYRDFYSSYAPLNPFLNALFLRIHNSALTLVVTAILYDIAAFPLWMATLRRFLPESTVRCAGLLMLLQPVVLWNRTIDGSNESLLCLLMALAVYFVARQDAVSGVFSTLPLVLVKFLPMVYLPSLLLAARRRVLWLLGAAVLPAAVYGYCLLRGLNILQPLQVEGGIATAGGLHYILVSATGVLIPYRFMDTILLLAMIFVVVWIARAALRIPENDTAGRLWILTLGLLAILLTLLTFSKKSYPSYLTALAFPLAAYVAAVARPLLRSTYAVLIFVSMIATTVWYGPMHMMWPQFTHDRLVAHDGAFFLYFAIETIPVVCYLVLLALILKDIDLPLRLNDR